jgi:hypothetical protein
MGLDFFLAGGFFATAARAHQVLPIVLDAIQPPMNLAVVEAHGDRGEQGDKFPSIVILDRFEGLPGFDEFDRLNRDRVEAIGDVRRANLIAAQNLDDNGPCGFHQGVAAKVLLLGFGGDFLWR